MSAKSLIDLCDEEITSERLAELAQGELEPGEGAHLLDHVAACRGCQHRLARIRKTMGQLSSLPAGAPAPRSLLSPDPPVDLPPLPANLAARLKTIPDRLEEDLQAREAVVAGTKSTHGWIRPGWTRWLKSLFEGRNVVIFAGACAAAVLLFTWVPRPSLLGPGGSGGRLKGTSADMSPDAGLQDQWVRLELVARGADGRLHQLEPVPASSRPGGEPTSRVQVIHIPPRASFLPVVLSPVRDLSLERLHIRLLTLGDGAITPLYDTAAPVSLARLPGTEHLFALPENLELTRPASGAEVRRLVLLLTSEPIPAEKLRDALTSERGRLVWDPVPTLEAVKPLIGDGLVGTVLLEVK